MRRPTTEVWSKNAAAMITQGATLSFREEWDAIRDGAKATILPPHEHAVKAFQRSDLHYTSGFDTEAALLRDTAYKGTIAPVAISSSKLKSYGEIIIMLFGLLADEQLAHCLSQGLVIPFVGDSPVVRVVRNLVATAWGAADDAKSKGPEYFGRLVHLACYHNDAPPHAKALWQSWRKRCSIFAGREGAFVGSDHLPTDMYCKIKVGQFAQQVVPRYGMSCYVCIIILSMSPSQ